jgi:hypothetical protein
MWHTILAIVSVLWILVSIFLIYAASHLLFTFDWKLLVIAAIVWAIITASVIAAGILAE